MTFFFFLGFPSNGQWTDADKVDNPTHRMAGQMSALIPQQSILSTCLVLFRKWKTFPSKGKTPARETSSHCGRAKFYAFTYKLLQSQLRTERKSTCVFKHQELDFKLLILIVSSPCSPVIRCSWFLIMILGYILQVEEIHASLDEPHLFSGQSSCRIGDTSGLIKVPPITGGAQRKEENLYMQTRQVGVRCSTGREAKSALGSDTYEFETISSGRRKLQLSKPRQRKCTTGQCISA